VFRALLAGHRPLSLWSEDLGTGRGRRGDFDLDRALAHPRLEDRGGSAAGRSNRLRRREIRALRCQKKETGGRRRGPPDVGHLDGHQAPPVPRRAADAARWSKRTNEKREAEGKMLLPPITPHTLRRTFRLDVLLGQARAALVMDQIGHEDSR